MNHEVTISLAGFVIPDWTSYEIQLDLSQPVSVFSLSGPFTAERFELLEPGTEVVISIDDRPVIAGYITTRQTSNDQLTVNGHDKCWLLVRDAAPLKRIDRDTIGSLAQAIIGEHFTEVVFQNAQNRALYGGNNRKPGREPPVFNSKDDPRKIPIGATRWSALAEVLKRADLLAWSSADGRSLVIAKPNFSQEPRHEFRIALPEDSDPSNCTEISVVESIESRYRQVSCMGSARTTNKASYGLSEKRTGTVVDETMPLDIRARLIEDIRDINEAKTLAQHTLDDARAGSYVVTVEAWNHGQNGRLYTPDTTADIIDSRIGLSQRFYCTAVTYSADNSTEQSTLTYVPLNTRIVIA